MKQLSMNHRLRQGLSSSLVAAAFLWGAGAAMAQKAVTPMSVHLNGSSLTFNTTKSGVAGVGGVTETMQFKRFEGGLDEKGRITLKIDLSSIDSGIGIRDERMQSMLWNVGQYPSVTFSGQVKPEALPTKVGESVVVEVQGELSMAGQNKPLTASLNVTALQGKWLVSTRKPVLVKADEFGLTSGVEALRAIMGLNYLSSSAPVTFSLELQPAGRGTDKHAAAAPSQALPPSAW